MFENIISSFQISRLIGENCEAICHPTILQSPLLDESSWLIHFCA